MDRYSLIETKLKREFVLLQGLGCRWRRCAFCNYHEDVSESPYKINKEVLSQVTGVHGVLDVINSGSAMELDGQTLALIKQIVMEKNIHTLTCFPGVGDLLLECILLDGMHILPWRRIRMRLER